MYTLYTLIHIIIHRSWNVKYEFVIIKSCINWCHEFMSWNHIGIHIDFMSMIEFILIFMSIIHVCDWWWFHKEHCKIIFQNWDLKCSQFLPVPAQSLLHCRGEIYKHMMNIPGTGVNEWYIKRKRDYYRGKPWGHQTRAGEILRSPSFMVTWHLGNPKFMYEFISYMNSLIVHMSFYMFSKVWSMTKNVGELGCCFHTVENTHL